MDLWGVPTLRRETRVPEGNADVRAERDRESRGRGRLQILAGGGRVAYAALAMPLPGPRRARGPFSTSMTSQTAAKRKASEPGTHMITPAVD